MEYNYIVPIHRYTAAAMEYMPSNAESVASLASGPGLVRQRKGRQAHDERGVPGIFTPIAACKRDIKNGLCQNLSLPFIAGVASACNGGSRALQPKANRVNKIDKSFFTGPLISLQNIAFSQSKIAQFLKKSRVARPEAQPEPTSSPYSTIFGGPGGQFCNTSSF